MRALLLTLATTAAALLGASGHTGAQVTAASFFYEIDGDYGSTISDVDGDGILDITDGGTSTWGRRDTPDCTPWAHSSAVPYMGSRFYTVSCLAVGGRRSEQMMVKQWYAGTDSARTVSFAFRLRHVPVPPTVEASGFITQLHGTGSHAPPFLLKWRATPGVGYTLAGGAKYDVKNTDGSVAVRQPYFYEAPITPGMWHRVMVQLDPGPPIGTGECPQGAGENGRALIWLMDNASGSWGPVTERIGQLGYRWHPDGTCLDSNALSYTWKVGQYVVLGSNTLDLDNIAYGKRWNNITKNRLVGYRKSVLRLSFEELSGSKVDDWSWTWNGGSAGDPTRDYGNDGRIVGTVARISSGVHGRALRFSGKADNYVKVPIDPVDFDVGNYMTVSAWFRTVAQPSDNKGLVMIDEYSTSWKLLLYLSRNSISFGVRHPGTYSRLDHFVPIGHYSNNRWHLVTGTFNRFAPDGQRIKLYVDGVKVMEAAGNDLPVLRGENRLVVGKFSISGFFQGDIDDVGLFNYAMTAEDVESLWLARGAP